MCFFTTTTAATRPECGGPNPEKLRPARVECRWAIYEVKKLQSIVKIVVKGGRQSAAQKQQQEKQQRSRIRSKTAPDCERHRENKKRNSGQKATSVCVCVVVCVFCVCWTARSPSAGPPCAVSCVCVCCVCVCGPRFVCSPDPPPSAGPPKISLFFPSPATHFQFFFLSLGVFPVEFWWCF